MVSLPQCATASIRSGSGSSIYTTTTGATGDFNILSVNPGAYDLVVEAPGFLKVKIAEVKVNPSRATDIPAIKGHLPLHDDTHIERCASDSEPFSALAFKVATDPYVGRLTFFRVYSGALKSGSYVYNSTKDKKERIGRLLQMHANKRDEIEEVLAGDIAAAIGLKDTRTGDTLKYVSDGITGTTSGALRKAA